jgi:internalin A
MKPSRALRGPHHTHLFSLAALAVLALGSAGCDEEKPKGDAPKDSGATIQSMATMPVNTAALSASAAAAASAAPAKKKITDCPTGDTVDTQDAALLAEIRKKLQKKPSDPPVKMSELPNVKSINLIQPGGTIQQIDPCLFPKMTNLHDLFLGPGDYDDLTPVANLNQLLTLGIANSKVTDLKPISNLAQLDRLDISHTPIRDLTVVGTLANLTEIQIDESEVTDISPLANCKKLEKVSLKKTMVSDLSPLKNLQKLKYVYIQGAAVTDTSPLQAAVGRGAKIVTTGR